MMLCLLWRAPRARLIPDLDDDMFIMESASRPVIPDLVPLPSAGVLAWPRRRGRPW